jgi:hypothetical protein
MQISGNHMQERHCFLFDNLFVYCKKSLKVRGHGCGRVPSTVLHAAAGPRVALPGGVGVGTCQSFSVKGKIFTENMTVMDLEDGEFQWRRSPVSHAIRIKNESKNKWCVSA